MLVRPPDKYSLSEVFLGRGGEPISQYTTITFGRGRTNICYNTHAQFFLGGGRTNMFRPIRGREIISDTQTENQHTVRPCSTSSACKNHTTSWSHLQDFKQSWNSQFGPEWGYRIDFVRCHSLPILYKYESWINFT